MSLTTIIKQKNISSKFNGELKHPFFKRKGNTLATSLTKHLGLVETALDYILRFYLERTIKKNDITRDWVVYDELLFIKNKLTSKDYKVGNNVIVEAMINYSRYIEYGNITDELFASALKLAKIDNCFLCGYFNDLDEVDSADIEDLKNLYRLSMC